MYDGFSEAPQTPYRVVWYGLFFLNFSFLTFQYQIHLNSHVNFILSRPGTGTYDKLRTTSLKYKYIITYSLFIIYYKIYYDNDVCGERIYIHVEALANFRNRYPVRVHVRTYV